MNLSHVVAALVGLIFGAFGSSIHSAISRATTIPAKEEAKIDPTGTLQAGLSVVGAVANAEVDAEAAKLTGPVSK